jgi:hypothetical protein
MAGNNTLDTVECVFAFGLNNDSQLRTAGRHRRDGVWEDGQLSQMLGAHQFP